MSVKGCGLAFGGLPTIYRYSVHCTQAEAMHNQPRRLYEIMTLCKHGDHEQL